MLPTHAKSFKSLGYIVRSRLALMPRRTNNQAIVNADLLTRVRQFSLFRAERFSYVSYIRYPEWTMPNRIKCFLHTFPSPFKLAEMDVACDAGD
jgi:hypothetical protein